MMTQEEFIKIEKEWVKNEIPTMFYIGELQRYKNSLEERIAKLETLKTCDGCQYEHLDRYGDNHCKFENMCMRDFDDYYKAKEN
jgi:deoxyribodipyrimidine photolyase-like uncharacterized protein